MAGTIGNPTLQADTANGGPYSMLLPLAQMLASDDGTLISVSFYSHAVGTLKVKIFRDDGTYYRFIGEDSVTTINGFNENVVLNIPGVLAGDLIGWYSATTNASPDRQALTGGRKVLAGDITTDRLKTAWTTQNYSNRINGVIAISLTGTISEGEKSGDTVSRKLETTKQISDGSKLGEAFTRYSEIIRNLLEGAKAGDAFAASVTSFVAGSIIDGVVAGDSFSEIWAGTAHLTEGAKGGDGFAASVYEADTSFISEGFRLGDAITATSPLYTAIGEGTRASDFFATVMDYIGKRTEGAKFGDSFRWIPIIFQALEVVEIESMVTLNTEFQSLVTKTKTLDSVITRTVCLNSMLDMSITMSRS